MELTWIWEVILRRNRVIIQAVLVVGLTALVAGLIATPVFKASSKIMIMDTEMRKEGPIGIGAIVSPIIRTSADIGFNRLLATSKPYIDDLIRKLQLRDDKGSLLQSNQLTRGGIASRIKRKIWPLPEIKIWQITGARVLEIGAFSRDRQEAMTMANTLAHTMVVRNQKQVRAEYRSASSFLEGQMEKVRKRYDGALVRLADFQKKERTVDLETETKLSAGRMERLMKDKEETIRTLAESHAIQERLKEQLNAQNPGFISASAMKENPHIEILKKRLTQLKIEFAEATSELTENHPRVKGMRKQIKFAEAELKAELKVYQASAPGLTALDQEIDALEARLKGIDFDTDKYVETLAKLPDKVIKRETLNLELKVTQDAYSSLLSAINRIGVAEATTLSEIRVVERAALPTSPTSPKRAANVFLGCAVGLLLGLCLSIILEYLDDTIGTSEDVKEFEPVALIGTIPEFEKGQLPLISRKDPNDPLYESYRKIRNFVTMNEKPIKAFLVASAGPGEGKSTTVANLGISVSRGGKKAVIIDLDLRRASLHTHFGLPGDVGGMADLLQGRISVDEAIQATGVEGLNIIPSGLPFSDPGGLIESDQMGRIITELKTRFDVVILDSAPMLVKSDALVLAKYVDGSIIVLESGKTTRRAVIELMKALAEAHIKPLGFVLNRLSVKKGSHSYHQYYYGHPGRELPSN